MNSGQYLANKCFNGSLAALLMTKMLPYQGKSCWGKFSSLGGISLIFLVNFTFLKILSNKIFATCPKSDHFVPTKFPQVKYSELEKKMIRRVKLSQL